MMTTLERSHVVMEAVISSQVEASNLLETATHTTEDDLQKVEACMEVKDEHEASQAGITDGIGTGKRTGNDESTAPSDDSRDQLEPKQSVKGFSNAADTKHQRVADDLMVKGVSGGTTIETIPMLEMATQEAWGTAPKALNDKYYLCPSNTIVASNGGVYHVEPFMLPPPDQISMMIRELQVHRDRGGSHGGGPMTPQRASGHNGIVGEHSPIGKRKAVSPFKGNEKEVQLHLHHFSGSVSSRPDSPHVEGFNPMYDRESIAGSANESTRNSRSSSKDTSATSIMPVQISRKLQINTQSMPPSYDNWLNMDPKPRNDASSAESSKATTPNDAASTPKGSRGGSLGTPTHPGASPQHVHDRELRQRRGRGSGGGGSQGGSSSTKISLSAIPTPYANIKSVMQASKDDGEFDELFDSSKFSILKYLQMEMFGMGDPCKGDAMEANKTIENFLSVPMGIERVVVFGFLICIDAYLYVFTFLPIRVAFSTMLLIWEFNAYVYQKLKQHTPIIDIMGLGGLSTYFTGRVFHRTNAYDIMRALLLVLGAYALSFLHMSRVYHYIRQQTTIKLYVLTGMMEIFDKLLGSFGQDAFDSMYALTRSKTSPQKLAISFVVALLYVILHSMVYFVTIATLTVAINSNEQALITVLILNNFAEIKSFVFKKFDRLMMFQLACKDITERFQIVLFLMLIMVVSLVQAGSAWMEILPSHIMIIFYMWISEMLADWTKHAFLAKFNVIDASIYADMLRVLRKDVLKAHKDNVILDHTYTISRRVGLSQIPLACVSVRYLWLALDSPMYYYQRYKVPLNVMAMHFTTVYLLFLGVQTAIGIGLIFYCGRVHNKEVALTKMEMKVASPTKEDAARKRAHAAQKESIEKLSNIERYTAYKGRIVG